MLIDVSLTGDLSEAATRAGELAATGIDGLFTFEGNSDVFFPLVHATKLDVDLYTNVTIAFPRSPMHLAYQPGIFSGHPAAGSRWDWAHRSSLISNGASHRSGAVRLTAWSS